MKVTRKGLQWLRERAKDLGQSSLEETLLAAVASGKSTNLYPISDIQVQEALERLEEAELVR